MHQILIKNYTYELEDEKIAKHPLVKRDASKLLVYNNGNLVESIYSELQSHLPANCILIFNNTKVDEVRLLFTKQTGSVIEIFCLEPGNEYPDITTAMAQKRKVIWKCLVGGAKKWKEGLLVKEKVEANKLVRLTAKKGEKKADYFLIEFEWNMESSFAEILHLFGEIPLPPYLNREVESEDNQRYQTVYAKYDGSVAAPTAGLHFTEELFANFEAKNIQHDFVTLHVGAGTFKPIKTETVAEHEMHSEYIEVRKELIENLLRNIIAGNKIIAVGTTSLRTIESLYWMGVKVLVNEKQQIQDLEIKQWEVYEMPQEIATATVFAALINWMEKYDLQTLFSKTKIIIVPGYKLRVADALITNFHQPQSTLLLLIAAIVGDDWKRIYEYALQHNFRFLSYGDGSLLWK